MTIRGEMPADWAGRVCGATAGYKAFQLDTVAAVVHAMFVQDQRRFLVADEVGLGKTKTARALVAETVDRLWHDPSIDRIDIVYICSNAQIARQNLRDLDLFSDADHPPRRADRLTMLPGTLAKLGAVNLIALTPSTSFGLGHQGGRVGERAMLWRLLEHEGIGWADLLKRKHAIEIFRVNASTDSFQCALDELDAEGFNPPDLVIDAFAKVLQASSLRDNFERLSDGRRKLDSERGRRLIGTLRRKLAEVCIGQLTPDLIILDEFQRFSNLLRGNDAEGELARILFDQPDARVLLLSATPYKMLTSADDDESHYDQFLETVGFLLGDERTDDLQHLKSALSELRAGILEHHDPDRLRGARDTIQRILGSVMVRTERLASTPDRDGMLDTSTRADCAVHPSDVTSFIATDRIAQELDRVPSMVEFWKSAPYLYNFMDDYVAKKRMREILPSNPKLRQSLRGNHVLTGRDIEAYQEIDPRNGRLRWMIDDLDAAGAFNVLWIPPSMPQTELAGPYADAVGLTKRLVFSGWGVVPKAVASLLSYEYERRHHRKSDAEASYRHSREGNSRPFRPDTLTADRGSQYGALALLLPCMALAEIGDPLVIAHSAGARLPLPLTLLRTTVRADLERRLEPLLRKAPRSGTPLNVWYAAAQLWLDRSMGELEVQNWTDREPGGLADHWSNLISTADQIETWGRPPDDLLDRLTDIAIAGPAVTALRSLSRLDPRFDERLTPGKLRKAAAEFAWAMTALFHTPEALQIVRASGQDGQPDWVRLLEHCADGGFGSVLDEWLHLVPDQLRLARSAENPLPQIVSHVQKVLELKASGVFVDVYGENDESDDNFGLRTHFAMRFGQARGVTAEGENPVEVRNAFNSPFRPFVLVSTSVGQEGLDFHHYAHAIVHWNLPHNPVDLEQREGRVHRYKNHAVRKNVAAAFLQERGICKEDGDLWSEAFDHVDDASGGMRPEWIFDGDAKIQRLVPLLPMSRDVGKLDQLVRATSLYRMAIGQPRQAELLEVLSGLSEDEQKLVLDAVSVDLSPPPRALGETAMLRQANRRPPPNGSGRARRSSSITSSVVLPVR